MIAINDYRQFIAELVTAASHRSGVSVGHVRLAVTESQLVTLLKDLQGIIVCGNIPVFDISHHSDHWVSAGECLLMVLQKMPRDLQGSDEEYLAYAHLQLLMSYILRLITGDDFQKFCDHGNLDTSRPFRIEWEYNSYGGFNGLSVTFRLTDINGSAL